MKTIPFECDNCGEVFDAEVDEKTYEPENGYYGPCTECGDIFVPFGVPTLYRTP